MTNEVLSFAIFSGPFLGNPNASKTSKNFSLDDFYLEVSCTNNKKGLFYAKFFEFEDYSSAPFFWVALSLSALCISKKHTTQN